VWITFFVRSAGRAVSASSGCENGAEFSNAIERAQCSGGASAGQQGSLQCRRQIGKRNQLGVVD
jgi:hypothetical protein